MFRRAGSAWGCRNGRMSIIDYGSVKAVRLLVEIEEGRCVKLQMRTTFLKGK